MVDDKKISMRPAVELSYLPKVEQEILYDIMESEACTPSHAQAIKIRKFSAEGRLNEDVLLSIMSEEKPNQVEQWKKPLSKHWNYTGNGKKAGNDRHFDTKGEVYLLAVNEKSAFFCFPLPTPYPFGLPADCQPKRQ